LQIVLVSLFFLLASTSFAQDKWAITVGADHEGGKEFVKAQNIRAHNSLKEAGYKVRSLFGNEAKAKEFSKSTKSYTRPFTEENLKKSIAAVYEKPCHDRPSQLMINFVAHGSRNGTDPKTKKSIPRHSINGVEKTGEGSYGGKRIYVDNLASFLKKQRAKDSSCDKPKLAIIDHSCKSGASTNVFKGLGCVLTSTSSHNSASTEYIHETFEKMKQSKGQSLADLHLDMLVNQEVSLVNIDYKDGKTLLQKIYNDTNQISGCGDEEQVNYSGYSKHTSKKYAPLCQEYVAVLAELRGAEIGVLNKIVSKLRIDAGVDKSELAKAAGVEAASLPDSEALKQNLEELIEEDAAEFDKITPLAMEESKLMNHEDLRKGLRCGLKTGPRTRSSISNSDLAEKMGKTLCHSLYSDERKIRNCSASSRNKVVGIDLKDLLQIKRDHKVYPSKRAKGYLQKRLSDSGKPRGLGARSNSSYEILNETVSSCLKKYGESGTDAQKAAIAFFNKNYKKTDASCSENTIACHKAKADERAKKIKKQLSYARGYAFLSCKAKLKNSEDLKACEDFKI
tara:strand:+ start:42458 stop:44152 length:1695 start_codon:yes stop_codon:yes gene_type:complete